MAAAEQLGQAVIEFDPTATVETVVVEGVEQTTTEEVVVEVIEEIAEAEVIPESDGQADETK